MTVSDDNDFRGKFAQNDIFSAGSSLSDKGHKLNWNQASLNLSQQGKAYVLITIVGVTGSTPRNSGTKMVVSNNDIFDTIGGGHLEFKAIKQAKKLLLANKDSQIIEHFQLGSQLGQCCGGNASVLFECFAANTVHIAVFGAGHVGQALIPMLAGLSCNVTWVDNREAQFPANSQQYANVTQLITDDPASEVSAMASNTLFVVMTHNHQLDFDISLAVLKREDFHYLGLIASDTKWRRFQQRYKHREIKTSLVEQMNCPIGLEQVVGKMPMEVAISVAGKIIESYQTLLPSNQLSTEQQRKNKGVAWKDIKQLIFEQDEQISQQANVENSTKSHALMSDEHLIDNGAVK
jgi:xanthine dehydrogenase accessory factor